MSEDTSMPGMVISAVKAVAESAKALAEPARLAIEKLAVGAGRLYEPTHVRRIAMANADKKFINAIGKEDLAVLQETAENRARYRKLRQETNLQLIADRASRLFGEETPAGSAAPADEWVDEFTDQSKDASTDELRELWALVCCGNKTRRCRSTTYSTVSKRHGRDVGKKLFARS